MSRSDVLVDAEWVVAHAEDPTAVLVEVDEDTAIYATGHISGAVRLDWRTDLQDGVRCDVVDKAAFEALLSQRGIRNEDTVVFYGANNNWFAGVGTTILSALIAALASGSARRRWIRSHSTDRSQR